MQFKRRSEIVERQELLRIQPSQTNGLSAPAAAAEVPDSTMLLQFSAETWTCVLKWYQITEKMKTADTSNVLQAAPTRQLSSTSFRPMRFPAKKYWRKENGQITNCSQRRMRRRLVLGLLQPGPKHGLEKAEKKMEREIDR
jgi:hypothetical protein